MASENIMGGHLTFGRDEAMPTFGDAMSASAKLAGRDTPTANLLDIIDLKEKQNGPKVSFDILNEKYDLDLREDTTEAYAQTVFETRKRTAELQNIVKDGTRNSQTLGMVASFGIGMVPEIVDPINIGATLLLGPGASRLFGSALKARNKFAFMRSIARKGAYLRQSPLALSLAENIGGNLVADGFVVYGNDLKKTDAKIADILAMSVAGGAFFPIVGGLFKKMLQKIDARSSGSAEMEMDHNGILSEHRLDVEELGDDLSAEYVNGVTIANYNDHLNNINTQIKDLESYIPKTESGAKQKTKDLIDYKKTRDLVLLTRDDILKANKDKLSLEETLDTAKQEANLKVKVQQLERKIKEKVESLEEPIAKLEKKMDELEDQIYTPIKVGGRAGIEQKKIQNKLISEYNVIRTQKDFLRKASNILDTSLASISKQKELDEIDSLLFGNRAFNYISLDSENIGKLAEYQKSSIDNGLKPDMETAVNSILRKNVLPKIQKEIDQLEAKVEADVNRVVDRIPDDLEIERVRETFDLSDATDVKKFINEREDSIALKEIKRLQSKLDSLKKKAEEINRLPTDKEEAVKTVKRLYTHFDPDEKYKGVEADEMEELVFKERNMDPEFNSKLLEIKKASELSVNCRLMELSNG